MLSLFLISYYPWPAFSIHTVARVSYVGCLREGMTQQEVESKRLGLLTFHFQIQETDLKE